MNHRKKDLSAGPWRGNHSIRKVRELVTLHLQSGSRERERDADALTTFSFLFSLGPHIDWCHPVRVGLVTSVPPS